MMMPLLISLSLFTHHTPHHFLTYIILLITSLHSSYSPLRLQSIIEEEGGSIKQQGPDDIPWDQPLIIAEPDTKVSAQMRYSSYDRW